VGRGSGGWGGGGGGCGNSRFLYFGKVLSFFSNQGPGGLLDRLSSKMKPLGPSKRREPCTSRHGTQIHRT